MSLVWLILVLLAAVAWLIYAFNSLVSLNNQIDDIWARIDSQLVRRYEIATQLLDLLKTRGEPAIFERLTAARAAALNAFTPNEKSRTDSPLDAAIDAALSSAALPSTEELDQIKHTLKDIRDYLRLAGRGYNEIVTELNSQASRFPNRLLAPLFGVQQRELYQPDAAPKG